MTSPRVFPSPNFSRRQFLTAASLTVAGVAGGSLFTAAPTSAAVNQARSQWPGHQPGRVYLGVSTQDLPKSLQKTGSIGLYRTYYRWNDANREMRNIKADHVARRMPWISFKPPFTSKGGWAAVASGKYDADIRARARRYAQLSRPVIVTFNHEPHNDNTGTPAEFAKAWCRIHNVMRNETGLKNVVSVPILGDWEFNPVNKNGDPDAFLTVAVLDRCHFVGMDLYQNRSGQGYDERIGRVFEWLDKRGHPQKMVGLGETGATNDYGSPTGAQWWNEQWQWCSNNAQRVAAISYFNSLHNNNSGNDWLLWESSAKLSAYRSSLASATFCRLN